MNFQLATVAESGVDFADRKAAAKTAPCGAVDAGSELRERRGIRRGRRLRNRIRIRFSKMSLRITVEPRDHARIGAIEGLVAEREVGDDVALDHGLEERPLEPGRVTQVAALDEAAAIKPHPHEHVTAEYFDKSKAFPGFSAPRTQWRSESDRPAAAAKSVRSARGSLRPRGCAARPVH